MAQDNAHTHYLYGAHLSVNGIRQHYLRYGGDTAARAGRPPVLLLHGIASSAAGWGFVANQIGRHFDVYVLDVRGRGLSSATDALDYSLDAQAADLLAFASKMGFTNYTVVGHSMGARIAIRAAARADARLTRAVLVEPPVSGPGRRPYPARLEWYIDSIRGAKSGITPEEMKVFCPTWSDAHLRVRAEWLHTCNENAIRTSFSGFSTDDVHADLPRIRIPLHLITAERGDVVRDDDVAEITRLAPQITHARVASAGHMIPWENEQGFYEAFGSFLGCAIS